jgi:hypothetical protein
MKKDDIIMFLFGAFIGIVLTVLFVLVVNQMRFHAQCDGKVLSDSWGKEYCINPNSIKGTP